MIYLLCFIDDFLNFSSFHKASPLFILYWNMYYFVGEGGRDVPNKEWPGY